MGIITVSRLRPTFKSLVIAFAVSLIRPLVVDDRKEIKVDQ